MQLTLQDVSRFLDVPEPTITRWINQKGLPTQYVGGQYRFNRSEVLEWAAANQIKVSLELVDRSPGDRSQGDRNRGEDEPVPTLADALALGGIFYKLKGNSKEGALRSLVDVLPLPEEVDRDQLFRLFMAREAATSTAIGRGIALPHARNPVILQVERPLVTLCFLEQPVEFGASDGKPVEVLFSLICPTMRSHLQVLSRISLALHDTQFKDAIARQLPREDILREAQRVEEAMTSPKAATSGKVAD
jgi:PTS system nitrogen regulatory IIA component